MFFCRQSADYFQLKIHIRRSNSLDLDHDQSSVSRNLGPKCLQKVISKRQKSPLASKELSKKLNLLYKHGATELRITHLFQKNSNLIVI